MGHFDVESIIVQRLPDHEAVSKAGVASLRRILNQSPNAAERLFDALPMEQKYALFDKAKLETSDLVDPLNYQYSKLIHFNESGQKKISNAIFSTLNALLPFYHAGVKKRDFIVKGSV